MLFSTGVTAAVGARQAAAICSVIEEVNASGGVLGRPLAPVFADLASRSRRRYRDWPARAVRP